MFRHFLASALAVAALSAISVSATAAPVTFFGEDVNTLGDPNQVAPTNSNVAKANFFANLVGVGTETFEEFPAGTTGPLPISFGAAGTATLNGSFDIQTGNDDAGRYAISGNSYWYAGAGEFDVSFSSPISAFGFYGVDVGDFGGQLTLGLTDSHGVVTTLTVPNTIGSGGSTSGSILYFGFYDTGDTYTDISFNNNNAADNFAFDDFSIGSRQQVVPTIPEPSSWLLMALGLGAVGAIARRRSTKTSSSAPFTLA